MPAAPVMQPKSQTQNSPNKLPYNNVSSSSKSPAQYNMTQVESEGSYGDVVNGVVSNAIYGVKQSVQQAINNVKGSAPKIADTASNAALGFNAFAMGSLVMGDFSGAAAAESAATALDVGGLLANIVTGNPKKIATSITSLSLDIAPMFKPGLAPKFDETVSRFRAASGQFLNTSISQIKNILTLLTSTVVGSVVDTTVNATK